VVVIFLLVVQGNLQRIPSPKKKEHSSKVVKVWWAPKKLGLPWNVKEKVGRSAKVSKTQKNLV
jgi:hypothetical protein